MLNTCLMRCRRSTRVCSNSIKK